MRSNFRLQLNQNLKVENAKSTTNFTSRNLKTNMAINMICELQPRDKWMFELMTCQFVSFM